MSLVLREARETHYWLRLIQANTLCAPEDVGMLVAEADELVAIFTTAVRRAKQPADNF
jgi:four helix bundle protein